MRSADQIKRKVNELLAQQTVLERKLAEAAGSESEAAIRGQMDRLADSILLLEWVLDAPTGSYHV